MEGQIRTRRTIGGRDRAFRCHSRREAWSSRGLGLFGWIGNRKAACVNGPSASSDHPWSTPSPGNRRPEARRRRNCPLDSARTRHSSSGGVAAALLGSPLPPFPRDLRGAGARRERHGSFPSRLRRSDHAAQAHMRRDSGGLDSSSGVTRRACGAVRLGPAWRSHTRSPVGPARAKPYEPNSQCFWLLDLRSTCGLSSVRRFLDSTCRFSLVALQSGISH